MILGQMSYNISTLHHAQIHHHTAPSILAKLVSGQVRNDMELLAYMNEISKIYPKELCIRLLCTLTILFTDHPCNAADTNFVGGSFKYLIQILVFFGFQHEKIVLFLDDNGSQDSREDERYKMLGLGSINLCLAYTNCIELVVQPCAVKPVTNQYGESNHTQAGDLDLSTS